MAGDPVRGRVVLFGGSSSDIHGVPAMAGDTWEWDQGRWTHVQDVGPSPRTGAKAAYEVDGAVVLLFGGSSDPATWAWEGTRWTQVAHTGPSVRQGHGPSRARVE